MDIVERRSTITCPQCGSRADAIMPTDFCLVSYDCRDCGANLRPLAGDCCVYCSFGSAPCPSIQSASGR
ncbi:MAG: GDCCVxC domain-containing (seleno)protein [Alphaproteobacteria bacterium]